LSRKDSKFYTGFTKDLKLRFEQHNKGLVETTRDRRPLELIYYEACLRQEDALKREKYLKSYHGKMFIRKRLKSYLTGWTEGAARTSKKEFLQFINVAQGSASELDTQIELAKELGYIDDQNYDEMICLLTIISKQLYGLARKVRVK
jgi:putative endonuclease